MQITTNKIPLWIYFYGTLLFLFGLSLSIINYIDIHYFLKTFSLITKDDAKGASLLTSRILVQAILMFLALISKNPKLLALAFIQRFITEIFDCYSEMKYGIQFTPFAILVFITSTLLIPELVIILKLLKMRA